MKKSGLAAATAALIFFQAALANGNGTGNISGYVSYASGSTEYFFFNTSDLTGSPACNVTGRFVISSADPKFKTTVAMVISAYLAGTPVIVAGTGACGSFGNSEDVINVVVGSIPH